MNYDKLSRSLRYYYEKVISSVSTLPIEILESLAISQGIMQKVAGERYVYKFVCDPDALFQMALAENHRNALRAEAASVISRAANSGQSSTAAATVSEEERVIARQQQHYQLMQQHHHEQQQQQQQEQQNAHPHHHQYSDMLNQVYANHLNAQLQVRRL